MISPALRHLALKSRDLHATERFYCDVLGLEIAFPHDGMLFLRTPAGDDLLNFVETRKAFDPKAGGFDHFGFHVPGARWKKVLAELKRAGVKIRGRRGRWAVYIRDPNGYTVELYRD
jgi:catechol 2,3-dioxygenase-like lactoylglutathione lyase family enzyme